MCVTGCVHMCDLRQLQKRRGEEEGGAFYYPGGSGGGKRGCVPARHWPSGLIPA